MDNQGGHTNRAFDDEQHSEKDTKSVFDTTGGVLENDLNENDTELHEITLHQTETIVPGEVSQKGVDNPNPYRKWIKWGFIIMLNGLVTAYFVWATYHLTVMAKNEPYQEWPPADNQSADADVCLNPCELTKAPDVGYCPGYCGMEWCDGYGLLLILFALTYISLFYYHILKPFFGKALYRTLIRPLMSGGQALLRPRWIKPIIAVVILVLVLAFVVLDSIETPARLQSLSGIFVLVGIGYVFSAHRRKIDYQPVLCGFLFQFLLGVFCIRWEVGRQIFICLGDKATTFLRYTDEGTRFMYGDFLVDKNYFFFAVLPIIFFFSFIISILYYLEVMQFVVLKLGWILQTLLGTTVCESIICAANIFLGQTESPLLIRPYIKHLTASEIHVVMASGFATVSGSVLAAYISYGAEASHLITSSVMAAPAALAFSKLFVPETEQSKTKSNNMVLEKSTDSSILDAATNGATLALSIVLGITANIIAFVAFVAFLNGIVIYLTHLVGYEGVTFELLFAKLLIPLAWLIGIPWEDCEQVAGVIATKSIINEFVAYERLGVLKANNLISLRSSAIATYAICGFANPSSLGIVVATLGTMAPNKRPVIVSVAVRAFITGSIVCFLTASIAGILLPDNVINGSAQRSGQDYTFSLANIRSYNH